MDERTIQKIRERHFKAVERAEREGNTRELWRLDMEMEDSMVLKHGRVSGIVDEDELF